MLHGTDARGNDNSAQHVERAHQAAQPGPPRGVGQAVSQLGAAGVAGDGMCIGLVGAEDDLQKAAAVAQVDEDEPAVVSPAMHPARERDLAALIGRAQVAAIVGLVHVPLPANVVDVPQCSERAARGQRKIPGIRPKPPGAV